MQTSEVVVIPNSTFEKLIHRIESLEKVVIESYNKKDSDTTNDYPNILTNKQVQELLDCSYRKVLKLRDMGKIEQTEDNRFTLKSVEKYLRGE